MRDALPFVPARVLAIGAHPDDVEFFAGGTLLRLRGAGAAVTLVVASDGARGGRDLVDTAAIRHAEQGRAAELLGVEAWHWLAHPDGALAPGEPLLRQLVQVIRRVRPELVLAHDPRTLWTSVGAVVHPGHSDHRTVGQTTLDAVYPRAASSNFYWEQLDRTSESAIPGFEPTGQGEGVAPWYPRELWLFDTAEPDLFVGVDEVFEHKLELLAAHASQDEAAGGLVAVARAFAAHWGSPEGPREAFVRLRLY